MVVNYVNAIHKATELTCKSTNYLLPYIGEINIYNITDKIIYVNGEAIEVIKGKLSIPVRDINIHLEGDGKVFEVNIICSELQEETKFDYKLLGKTLLNNSINGEIDSEMLFLALEDEDGEEFRLPLCTFNRKFKKIKEKKDIDTILHYATKLPHIFYNPKLHLNQVNEIRPASVASRIGQESISHLASHSEHWKGIKASGLIPERLLARVLEDNYLIYENIAVKTLVDKLYSLEKKEREENLDCEMQIEVDDGHSVSSEQKNYFHAMSVLMRGMDEEDAIFMREILGDQKVKTDKILELLSKCKATPLYRILKKEKSIKGKLKKTNIFMMDNYYKFAFKLWNIIEKENDESIFANSNEISDEYDLYCKILFLFSLRYFNFEADNVNKVVLSNGKFGSVEYSFRDWKINLKDIFIEEINTSSFQVNLSIKDEIVVNLDGIQVPSEMDVKEYHYVEIIGNDLVFSEKISEQEQTNFINNVKSKISKDKVKQTRWALDIKQRLYTKFHSYSANERSILLIPWKYRFSNNSEEIRKALSKLKESVKNYSYDECYFMTISRPNEYSNVEETNVLNKMLEYISNNIEDKKDGNKVGVIPIGLNDINSFRRFTKIILTQMIKVDEKHEYCPICGDSMSKCRDGSFLCNNCGFEILDTQCSSCKNKFVYSRYKLPKTNSLETDAPGLDILIHENNLGYKNITDAEIIGDKMNPICPVCGN